MGAFAGLIARGVATLRGDAQPTMVPVENTVAYKCTLKPPTRIVCSLFLANLNHILEHTQHKDLSLCRLEKGAPFNL